jgi:hypothetical protein
LTERIVHAGKKPALLLLFFYFKPDLDQLNPCSTPQLGVTMDFMPPL